ncbi:hypothetical protein [Pseudomonas sp. S09G 359]|jgi:hypothetical protein|uniref:hypothetical protein n=1 Tax=Pseudomonas sp. S09G 359 TaxID=2054919 RepID=UPI000C6D2EB4|nr:hypothetical protein [Pseudomonas sp. S09G 359]AUG08842.1 hypothetical protein CXQ82_20465 [Pseudomonas sp. S09G 359]
MKKHKALKALEKMGHSSSLPDLNTLSGKDLFYSVFYIEDPRPLRKRYGPVMGGWMLAGCFSVAMTGLLILNTYLSGAPEDATLRNWFFSGLAINVVFSIAQIQVLYGHPHWTWVNVVIYLMCLLVSLPTIAYRPNLYLYAITLLAPLLGLLILNSNRCRELRRKSVEIRHKREAIIATLKQQGRWKWW